MSSAPIQAEERNPVQLRAEAMLTAHGGFLMQIFRRHLQEQDALDAFQSLCLKLLMKGLPDHIDDVRGYLYRTARNAVNDHARQSSTYQKKIQKHYQRSTPKPVDDPARKVMQFDLVSNAFERIEKHLSPSVSQVFVQKYQHNLNHHEIAEKLEIKKETVDRYLSVGTKQVKQLRELFLGGFDE